MNNTIENKQKKTLLDALESRYGHKMAREIAESIFRAAREELIPDFMPVKASSELVELFRGEARDILKKLKQCRKTRFEGIANVENLEQRRLEIEFRRVYRLYRISTKLFYPLYDKAMAGYRGKINWYGRSSETISRALAA